MNLYAYINLQTNKVNAVVPLDSNPQKAWVIPLNEDEECGQDWTYDANATPRFTAPPVVKVWTAYQFLLRFTEAELLAIRTAAAADPITWRFLTLATAAQEIIANDPQTIAGMDYLVSAGLLTEQRKAEILG